MRKKLTMLFLVMTLILANASLSGCKSSTSDNSSGTGETVAAEKKNVDYDDDDLDNSYENDSGDIEVNLNEVESTEDTGESDESGEFTAEEGTLVITSGGTYHITGEMNGGYIYINSEDDEKVKLVLDGATITSDGTPAIICLAAEKLVITTVEGTVNTITDTSEYSDEAVADGFDAAIYSKDDVTINGEGELIINGNYSHGVHSKDDLKLTGGTVTVNAVGDGLKGKDSVTIKDALVTIDAEGDGIQSSNSTDSDKGVVIIESGNVTIKSGNDGIQAETLLQITDGVIDITTGSGAKTSSSSGGFSRMGSGMSFSSSTVSMKGLKAESSILVSGGTVNISAADDTIHSNGSVVVSDNAVMTLASSDDGIHADGNLQITGGNITITQSYEGLEGANIILDGGYTILTASDDGLNSAGGSSSSTTGFGGWGGGGGFGESTDTHIYINGGTLYVNAGGDGLDSNGCIYITGGETYVCGPTDDGNTAVDYQASLEITGGKLLAVGSSGMAENVTGGTQCSALISLNSQSAGKEIAITDASGNVLMSFTPEKTYNCVLFSCPDMTQGKNYSVTVGGSNVTTISLSSQNYSSVSGGMGGGGMGGGGRGGQGGRGGRMW